MLLSGQGHEVTLWGDGNVLDLDVGDGHMDL